MGSDLINRKALKKYIGCDGNNKYKSQIIHEIADLIDEVPAVDAVEVVRCKDCAKRGAPDECPMCYHKSSAWYPCDNTEDDGFCNEGRKKDG